jgi:hypothetical protein
MRLTHSLVTMGIPQSTRLTEVPPEQRQILTVPFGLETVRADEPKRGGVHAVAETGGLRPVVEDVTERRVSPRERTSVRGISSERSSRVVTFSGSSGRVKLGHPVRESYLSSELNNGSPETTST